MSNAPIYIIGTERSGSNLLRLILHAHSRICVPHPLHLMRYFVPTEAARGDLSDPRRFQRLVDDILLLERVHIRPWRTKIDRQRVLDEAHPRNSMGVLGALSEQVCEAHGKQRWGSKSTFIVHYTDYALERDPDAKFILLVRDPRDVAASSRRSIFSPYHPWLTAELWRDQQAIGLDVLDRVGAGTVLLMRYEDLLEDPEREVRSMCEFIDEPFEPELLQYHQKDEARHMAPMSESWENIARPVIKNNAGKYRIHLNEEEVRMVEAVCGPLMERLGYGRDFPGQTKSPSAARRVWFRLLDRGWRTRAELRALVHDSNCIRRWIRDAAMDSIAARYRYFPTRARRGGQGPRQPQGVPR